MPGQSGPVLLSVLGTGKIGKTEAMSPLDQLCAGRGELPHSGYCCIAAPYHDAVAELSHAQQRVRILGRGVEDIDIVCKSGFLLYQVPEDFHRQPFIGLRQLEDVDITGQ